MTYKITEGHPDEPDQAGTYLVSEPLAGMQGPFCVYLIQAWCTSLEAAQAAVRLLSSDGPQTNHPI